MRKAKLLKEGTRDPPRAAPGKPSPWLRLPQARAPQAPARSRPQPYRRPLTELAIEALALAQEHRQHQPVHALQVDVLAEALVEGPELLIREVVGLLIVGAGGPA